MAEIHYKDVNDYISKLTPDNSEQVFLIFGEAFLVKKVLSRILDRLIPESDREFNCEKIDVEQGGVREALESVSTYSFLSEHKAVVMAIDDLLSPGRAGKPAEENGEDSEGDNGAGNDELKQSDAELVKAAVEKGFPGRNRLIMTAEQADKRRVLFKTVKKTGMVIDCSIPRGNRAADKKMQEAVLYESMSMTVTNNGKTMDRAAFNTLLETTGFDLSIFTNNLEKLISYVGDRERITREDVESLVTRTRKDPIFELTGAISDKQTERAIYLVGSLLRDGLYPLQILAGMINHIRKLLLVKDFTETAYGQTEPAAVSYDFFKANLLPAMIASDESLKKSVEAQEAAMAGGDIKNGTSNTKGTKTDLVMSKSAGNPYPAYQTFLAAGHFSRRELIEAVACMSEADILLKTSGQDHRVILERLVYNICSASSA